MSGRPRLCIVIPSLAPGGSERQALHLVAGLSQDFEVDVVCTREAGAWAKQTSAPVVALGIQNGWDPRQLGRLTKHFKANTRDLVQTYLSGFDFYANMAARRAGVPVVVSSRRERATWKRPRHVWLQRRANRYVDAIVANSHAVAEYAAAQEGETLNRYSVIYNGVATSSGRADARSELVLPPSVPVVGMVANFSADKDHALFVAMAERVRARRADTHFVLVGNGPLRETVQRSAMQRGLGDAFRFVLTCKDATPLYSAFDVAVLTSKTEGLPNTVLEAMVAGRPVVAAKVGGVPEVVTHGETGMLVDTRNPEDFADAVLNLILHPDKAARLGANAAAHMRAKFSVSAMVAAHRDLYLGLLDHKRRGA